MISTTIIFGQPQSSKMLTPWNPALQFSLVFGGSNTKFQSVWMCCHLALSQRQQAPAFQDDYIALSSGPTATQNPPTPPQQFLMCCCGMGRRTCLAHCYCSRPWQAPAAPQSLLLELQLCPASFTLQPPAGKLCRREYHLHYWNCAALPALLARREHFLP